MTDAAAVEPKINIPEWSVSELSAALKRTVEDTYGYVRVRGQAPYGYVRGRGEISGYKGAHSSGHCYFALKDETAKIDAVIWRREFARLKFNTGAGMEGALSATRAT